MPSIHWCKTEFCFLAWLRCLHPLPLNPSLPPLPVSLAKTETFISASIFYDLFASSAHPSKDTNVDFSHRASLSFHRIWSVDHSCRSLPFRHCILNCIFDLLTTCPPMLPPLRSFPSLHSAIKNHWPQLLLFRSLVRIVAFRYSTKIIMTRCVV